MVEIATKLSNELEYAYEDYFSALLDADDAQAERPDPPAILADLSTMAEENGFEHSTTSELSLIQLREDAFGRSMDADETAPQPLFTWIRAFREGELDLYEPATSYDSQSNLYLWLITDRMERVVPELDDVRDEVVAAWKREKAADKALERAEELAGEAEQSGKTLREFFLDDEGQGVFETTPFSFLTFGDVSQTTGEVSLKLSQPSPFIAPGPALLAVATGLETDGVGAALNHDHSIAYVVRVAARLDSSEELRAKFLSSGERWYGARAMLTSRYRRSRSDLLLDLLDSSELEWMRDPDEFR